MAVVDPYAPCPCGSGEKYKWCCQRVEEFAVRAQRLASNGQFDSAISVLDEGLRKSSENPWLAIQKALLLGRRGDHEPAKELLQRVLQKQPNHAGAQNLLVRLVLVSEDTRAAAGQLQRALGEVAASNRSELLSAIEFVGMAFLEERSITAAAAHFRLATQLAPEESRSELESTLQSIAQMASVSPWLRDPYQLSAVPEGIEAPRRERFHEALDWAEQGRWAAAAAVFDMLSAEGTPESDRNLGLCRLWLGDDSGAVEALRRYAAWGDITPDKVDLEALCQLISPTAEEDRVELLQWIWPVRDHDRLLTALRGHDLAAFDGRSMMEPDDPESFEVDQFLLLDKPPLKSETLPELDLIPRVEGRVLVGQEIVALEALDDGRLDGLARRFQELAGDTITPAHPRTKVLGESDLSVSKLRVEWLLPEGLDREEVRRFDQRERQRMILERWTEISWPYLGHRTPRQAAREGNAQLALRAAVCQLEFGQEFFREEVDFDALRRELGIDPEPPIDPETVEIEQVHLARLHRVPARQLNDERLLALFERAHEHVLPLAMERSAEALVDRPNLLDSENGVPRFVVFADLANLALSRLDREAAFSWARRGRESDPAASGVNAARWDFLEVRLHGRVDPPEVWVPMLAALMDRHASSEEAGPIIATNLVGMGLLRVEPNPNNPNEPIMDSRPLMAVLSQYGPRITTSTGELGVSASRGGIWTPGSEPSSSGGLWTPGSSTGGAQPGADKPRLIIPGR